MIVQEREPHRVMYLVKTKGYEERFIEESQAYIRLEEWLEEFGRATMYLEEYMSISEYEDKKPKYRHLVTKVE